jgi:hypothetical protein
VGLHENSPNQHLLTNRACRTPLPRRAISFFHYGDALALDIRYLALTLQKNDLDYICRTTMPPLSRSRLTQ